MTTVSRPVAPSGPHSHAAEVLCALGRWHWGGLEAEATCGAHGYGVLRGRGWLIGTAWTDQQSDASLCSPLPLLLTFPREAAEPPSPGQHCRKMALLGAERVPCGSHAHLSLGHQCLWLAVMVWTLEREKGNGVDS
jgi:hypothetical protein